MKVVAMMVAACAATGVFAVWAPWTYVDSRVESRFASREVTYRTETEAQTLNANASRLARPRRSISFQPQVRPSSAGALSLTATSNAALKFAPSQLFQLLPGWWLSATHVQVGDVTGDGRQDIVVLAQPVSGAPVGTYPQSTLYVFRQNLQGGFGAPLELKAGSLPHADVKLGDVDHDGDADIVAASSAGLSVRMYQPDGTFQYAYTSGSAQSLGLLDVNLDGRLDAVTRTYASGAIVWYGDGTGGFPGQETPHVIASGHQLAVGDITSDGLLDIVAPDNGQYVTEVVPHAQIAGGTSTRYQYEPSTYGPPPVVIGDFDNDGRKDVALAIQEQPTSIIHFRYQDATRTLGPASALALPARAEALVAADMDGDRRDDLVMVYGYDPMKLGVLLQTATGFGDLLSVTGMGYGAMGPEALAVGDLNSDGCRDAVAVTGDQIVLFIGSGCQKVPVAINCSTQLPAEQALAAQKQTAAISRRENARSLLTERRAIKGAIVPKRLLTRDRRTPAP